MNRFRFPPLPRPDLRTADASVLRPDGEETLIPRPGRSRQRRVDRPSRGTVEAMPERGLWRKIRTPDATGGLLSLAVWFGLVSGWLELGLVLALMYGNPHIPMDALRTNRQFAWMVPVSDVLIFFAVGLATAAAARFRPRIARQVAYIVLPAVSILTLSLNVEGLHPGAALALSCGIASVVGPVFCQQMGRAGRCLVLSIPVLAVFLIVLACFTYERVTNAERRALSVGPAARPGSPNVLLIVLDNVRAASMSLHGHDRPTTPNLDRLASRGLVFNEARSTAPWTLPSHAGMFTGRWPHELSVGWDLPLDDTYPTLAETLSHAGYATAGFVGNTYYCHARYGLGRGFARYDDAYENQIISLFEIIRSSALGKRIIQAFGYSVHVARGGTSVRKTAAMIHRDAIDWLTERPTGRPFFVFINDFDAHSPWVPEPGPSPRFGLAARSAVDRAAILRRDRKRLAGKPLPAGHTPESVEREANDTYRDTYESCLADLDIQLGVFFEELERGGLLENTLVVVTSDHGEHFRERGFLGHGFSVYRREVHVPLVIIPPGGTPSPIRVEAPVSLREIPATVAKYVGLGGRSPFPGLPLTRFVNLDTARPPDGSPVLSEVGHRENLSRMAEVPASLGPVRALIANDHVYICVESGREELYDLRSDPLETRNLAATPGTSTILDRLRSDLGKLVPESAHAR